MKDRENQQTFDFVLSDNRFMRASLTPDDEGSYRPGLSEIMNVTRTDIHPLLSPVPCEPGSGQYEAFIQLLGVVQWKVVRTNAILESVLIRQGVDDVCQNTLTRIMSHLAPGVKIVRAGVNL